jgi:hypothetical protein
MKESIYIFLKIFFNEKMINFLLFLLLKKAKLFIFLFSFFQRLKYNFF